MDAKDENELSKRILGAAFKVHSALGPGLLESAYEACLAYELRAEGFSVLTQVPLPLVYREVSSMLAIALTCWWRIW